MFCAYNFFSSYDLLEHGAINHAFLIPTSLWETGEARCEARFIHLGFFSLTVSLKTLLESAPILYLFCY